LARPVLGAASAMAVLSGDGALGAWLYLLGYLSDVADGWLVRRLRVGSARGRKLDGVADTIFHALVGAGLLGQAWEERAWWVIAVLIGLVVGERLLRRWVAPYTVVGKAVAGAYRIIVYSLFLPFAAPESRSALIAAGLFVVLITYAYEGRVTLAEFRSGGRTLR